MGFQEQLPEGAAVLFKERIASPAVRPAFEAFLMRTR
jgi:hypothetical protein